jgi:hypothetical protein
MTRPGRFEDTTIYVRPDGGAFRQFRVRCAVTGRVEHGCAAPGPAKKMLRELGWDYLPRQGWVSPEGLETLRKESTNG